MKKIVSKNKFTVSAPGKLMLFGEHAVVYGRPCIVTAIDQKLYLTAELTDKPFFELNAPDAGIKNYKKPISKLLPPRHSEAKRREAIGSTPKGAKFVELAVKNFLKKYPFGKHPGGGQYGIHITTHSDFSSQYGFGSSSASTVCTIFALSQLLNTKLTQKQVFDLAYKTVLDIQGKGSGFDVAATIYGGTLYFVTGGKLIQPLDLSSLSSPLSFPRPPKAGPPLAEKRESKNLPIPLIVAYSGIKADTTTILNQVAALSKKQPKIVNEIYNQIEKVVKAAKIAIEKKDWQTVGDLMNTNQGYLESLGVSSAKLSAMIYAARTAGAYGAKLSGAGLGDCIIALAPPSKRIAVEKAITKAGGKILKIKTNAEGVKLEP